ncbi:UPF0488 protein C8orf33 homolog [Trichomycterus rosablanca]|uniref:UPF0488 protein C8orf33 homolog n=1 Tax=Trichomycterus rosablanca TaxID=2290929 RepID=UPI002F355EDF
MQENITSVSSDFHWQHSDNSFTFNFLPDAGTSVSQYIMSLEETQPVQTEVSETSSGFAFNFQIPSATEGNEAKSKDSEMNEIVDQTSELSVDAKPKTKKKKKKKATGDSERREDDLLKNGKKKLEEAPKQENVVLNADQQLIQELDWCIEQLELGLRTQKSSAKQREEAARALKTLRSSKAPIVKKRQVMRAVSGDYRKKMEQERDRQFKLIHSAISSAKFNTGSQPSRKPVFHRRAETQQCTTHTVDVQEPSVAAEQTGGAAEKFVFRLSGEQFCFNFNL